VLVLLIFEPHLYPYLTMPDVMIEGKINPALHICIVALFAFLLNWMREIIKDIEDFRGDSELGCQTYPIKHGLRKSVHLVHAINLVTIIILMVCALALFHIKNYLSAAILCVPIISLMYFSYKLPLLSSFRQFGKLSALLKWLMIIGLLDLLVIVYL